MANGGKKNVLFIFGAGISLASCPNPGEPISTDTITKAIFTDRLQKNSEQWFDPEKDGEPSPIVDEGIHPLLRLIKYKFINHLRYREYKVTYEDIFYFLISHEREGGYAKNPLLKNAFAQFADEACLAWKAAKDFGGDYEFWEMLYLAQKYIKTVVKFRLWDLCEPEGYEWLSDAMQDEKYKSNIVTLNHDLLLDIFFKNEEIAYCDGFKINSKDKVKIFDPRCFIADEPFHLLKLHGSINWKAYGGVERHLVAIPMDGFEEHKFLDGHGPTDKIVILAGTHNKPEDYSYSIFSDLVAEYTRLLWTTDYVIICGYGFGDRGINSRLSNWLRLDSKNQILVIHPKGEKLKDNIKYPHAAELLKLIDPNRIHFEEKNFEDIKWDEVKKLI